MKRFLNKIQSPKRHNTAHERRKRIPLLSLPPEILLAILDSLPLSSVRAFGETSRAARQLATAVLAQYLELTQENVSMFRHNREVSEAVHYLRIRGELDPSRPVDRWDITMYQEFESFLGGFTNVWDLVITGLAHLFSWTNVDLLGRVIGANIRALEITVKQEESSLLDEQFVFKRTQSLHISYTRIASQDQIATILPNIHARFPALLHLNIRLGGAQDGMVGTSDNLPFFPIVSPDEYDSRIVFPGLKTFHLHSAPLTNYFYLINAPQVVAHLTFLSDHPHLEELTLPPAYPHQDGYGPIPAKYPPLGKLRYLRTSLAFAIALAPCFAQCQSLQLEEMYLDHILPAPRQMFSPFMEVASGSPRWPYTSVRILTLLYASDQQRPLLTFEYIPRNFPALEELHLDFHRMSMTISYGSMQKWNIEKNAIAAAAEGLRRCTVREFPVRMAKEYNVVRKGDKASYKFDRTVTEASSWDRHRIRQW